MFSIVAQLVVVYASMEYLYVAICRFWEMLNSENCSWDWLNFSIEQCIQAN